MATHRIGNWYRRLGNVYILVHNRSHSKENYIALVNLETGRLWSDPVACENLINADSVFEKISKHEEFSLVKEAEGH